MRYVKELYALGGGNIIYSIKFIPCNYWRSEVLANNLKSFFPYKILKSKNFSILQKRKIKIWDQKQIVRKFILIY